MPNDGLLAHYKFNGNANNYSGIYNLDDSDLTSSLVCHFKFNGNLSDSSTQNINARTTISTMAYSAGKVGTGSAYNHTAITFGYITTSYFMPFTDGVYTWAFWEKTKKDNLSIVYAYATSSEVTHGAGVQSGGVWVGRQGVDPSGSEIFDYTYPNTNYGDFAVEVFGFMGTTQSGAATLILTDVITGKTLRSGSLTSITSNGQVYFNDQSMYGNPIRYLIKFNNVCDVAISRSAHHYGGRDGFFSKEYQMFCIGSDTLYRFGHYTTSSNSFNIITQARPTQSWSHLAGTFDGTIASFYFNGNKVTSSTQNALYQPTNSQGLTIGRSQFFGQQCWADFDDFRLYNRCLSSSEISAIYNAGNGDENSKVYPTGKNGDCAFVHIERTITGTDVSTINPPYTIAYWHKMSDMILSGGIYPTIALHSGSTTYPYLRISLRNSEFRDLAYFGNEKYLYGGKFYSSSDADVWHHVVFTIPDSDIDNWNYYINGNLSNGIKGANTGNFYGITKIADIGINSSQRYQGYFDDVRIYNRILSQDEINAIYNSGSGTESNIYTDSTKYPISSNISKLDYTSKISVTGSIATASVVNKENYNDALLIHHKLNGNVLDSTTYGYHATEVNVEYASGLINQCVSFTSGSSYLLLDKSAPSAGYFEMDKNFTWCTWAKLSTGVTANYETIISLRATHGATVHSCRLAFAGSSSNNKLYCRFDTDLTQNSTIVGTGSYSDYNWHHAALTYDGSIKKAILYRDGNSEGSKLITGSWTLSSEVATWTLGYSNIRYFADDMRVYSKVLTETELRNIYNSGYGRETDSSYPYITQISRGG